MRHHKYGIRIKREDGDDDGPIAAKASVMFLLRILLALTSLVRIARSSPFEPHKRPRHGPWFEGWFTRISDLVRIIGIFHEIWKINQKSSKLMV